MSRHFLAKKEAAEVVSRLQKEKIPIEKGNVEVNETKSADFYFMNGKPLAYTSEGYLVPALKMLNELKPSGRFITVDDGAVPRLLNGANLFAQGIVELDSEIEPENMAYIRNTQGVYFAIGIVTRSASDIMANKQGEAVRIIHQASDRIYREFG